MKLYVARHGQTVFNAADKISGITDVELTQQGIEQARELAQKLADIKIDLIISSPMRRALDTSNIIAEICGAEVMIDERLREQNYGIFEGMNPKTPEFLEYKKCFAYKYPGGESMMQVAARTYPLIDEVKEKYEGKNVLLLCHGGVWRVIHTYFHDLTNEEFFAFKRGNCTIMEYDL